VSPNAFTVDLLLGKADSRFGKDFKMLRLGHSLGNADLNKKYSIEHLAGYPAGKVKDITPEKQEALDAVKL